MRAEIWIRLPGGYQFSFAPFYWRRYKRGSYEWCGAWYWWLGPFTYGRLAESLR